MDIANRNQNQIDAIQRDLPDAIEKPIVMKLNMNAVPFMDIILSGNMDGRSHELADASERPLRQIAELVK